MMSDTTSPVHSGLKTYKLDVEYIHSSVGTMDPLRGLWTEHLRVFLKKVMGLTIE